MSFTTFENCLVNIDGHNILCSQATLESQNSLATEFDQGNPRPVSDYGTTRVISQLSINYSISNDGDLIYKSFEPLLTGRYPIGVTGNIAGISFSGAHLTNLRSNGEPNSIISNNASFQIFSKLTGSLNPEQINLTGLQIGHGASTLVIGTDESLGFDMNISLAYEPIFRLGNNDSYPDFVRKTDGNQNFTLNGNKIEQFVSVSGEYAESRISIKDFCSNNVLQNYDITGRVSDHNLSVNVDGFLQGDISLVKFF